MIGLVSGLVGLLAAVAAATAVAALTDDDDRAADFDLHFTGDDADGASGTDGSPLVGEDADGTLVPADRFELLGGGLGSLRDHLGTLMVVNFFGSWCAPCRKEMPALQTVADELGDRVVFVGIAVRDRAGAARDFVRDTGVSYETGLNPTGDLATAMEVITFPTTLLVGADGRVVATHRGALTAAELRTLIDERFG